MAAYYNEFDPFVAAWLRELIKAGLIADGEVDERSIADVRPDDLRGFRQCHFFAGIGGWSYALRLAGWPDEREVWTGSCPCQPFSAAGKGAGAADSRDLWPTWFRLIVECRPRVVFGEQVASADGLGWIDRVSADVEAEAYSIGAVDLCAPSVGAFHIRQRLWFVAHTSHSERWPLPEHRTNNLDEIEVRAQSSSDVGERGAISTLDHAERERAGRSARSEGREECAPQSGRQDEGRGFLQAFHASAPLELGYPESAGLQGQRRQCGASSINECGRQSRLPGDAWSDIDWLPCIDGKARPIESGLEPLAHGVSGRVAIRLPIESATAEIQEHWYNRTGALKGFGNAIVPQVAAAFIESYLDLERIG